MTAGGRHDDRGAGSGGSTDTDDLVALLYGELGGDEERALRARVSADAALSGQLAEMEQVRELYRGLEDEEPPSRLSAQLMAAAAARGAVSAPAESAPGWWARFVAWAQPVLARPGLAAAMSVLLIAGVASVLLVRRGADVAKLEYSPDRSVVPDSTGSGEGQAGAPGAAPAAEAPAAGTATGDVAQDPALDGDSELATSPAESAREDAVEARRKVRARRSAGRASDEQAKDKSAKADDGYVDGAGPSEAKPQPADQPARAAAPEPPRPSPTGQESAESGSGGAADTSPPPPASAPAQESPPSDRDEQQRSLQRLHERAVTAAVNRRCLEVRSLAQSIRKLDAAYHDKVFVTDSRLSVCLFAGKPARSK